MAKNKNDIKKTAGNQDVQHMPLSKINYILIGACMILIVLGFILMCGSANEGSKFNADIFSNTRTVVAPTITFIGFVLMVWAILYRPKGGKKEEDI